MSKRKLAQLCILRGVQEALERGNEKKDREKFCEKEKSSLEKRKG